MKEDILFISHSEKDREFVRLFVDLLYQIGLTEKNIFCSSLPEVGVPLCEDIYEYLRNMLDSDTLIALFMLSDNYYDSVACLNEMGAIWVRQTEYFTFSLPYFNLEIIRGAINPRLNALDFNLDQERLKARLTEFKNRICSMFELESISENRWERLRDNFLDDINNSPNGICIDLNESKGYCIGGINRGGCCISINRDVSILKVTYDFNKTEVDCCSLVFFMGGIDIHLYKGITFWLKTKSDIDFFELELHLKTRDISKKIMIERESDWLKYVVYFKDYGGGKQEWTELKEIAFLVYRDDISLATLELKDLMIF